MSDEPTIRRTRLNEPAPAPASSATPRASSSPSSSSGGSTAARTILVTGDVWAIIVPADELEQLLRLEPAEAERVSDLVQVTLEAYCYPAVVTEPVPPPVHLAGLVLAGRFAGATLTRAGAIVGESVGSYSYRLARPLTTDEVMLVLGDELAGAIAPWAPRHSGTYTLVTGGELGDWPIDWWQRNLDNLEP